MKPIINLNSTLELKERVSKKCNFLPLKSEDTSKDFCTVPMDPADLSVYLYTVVSCQFSDTEGTHTAWLRMASDNAAKMQFANKNIHDYACMKYELSDYINLTNLQQIQANSRGA